jgi:type IV pilus assembly protein PilC
MGEDGRERMPRLGFRFNLRDQALFARRLSLLVRAGVPILESLQILKKQSRSRSVSRMFDHIIRDVANGRDLSRSLGRFRKVFGEFALNIIKVGETSGTLPENLIYLGTEIDKERELKRKVVGAMIYPILIVIMTFAVTALLTVFLFPKLLPIFQSLKVDLPWTTRLLLWISNFLIHYGFYLLIGIVVAIIGYFLLLRLKPVRLFMHRVLIRLPLMGSFFQDYQLTSICRTLGLLLKGSMTVLEAVRITGDTTSNLAYQEELKGIHRIVAKGGTISTHMEKRPKLFPPLVSQMIAIGEKTGNLAETFVYVAEIYEQDLDEKTKRLQTVIEPLLMIFMGLIVGFVAVSIITPIYDITQHLQPK